MVRDNEEFRSQVFGPDGLREIEFDECRFISCNFTDTDLSGKTFIDCSFQDCIFSGTKLGNTGFRDVIFKGCKILGINFSNCNQLNFKPEFSETTLDYSIFENCRLNSVRFSGCNIKEADFSSANLARASFLRCNLEGSLFHNTMLEEADFLTSYNFILDPENNFIHKAKFPLGGLPGLLTKYELEID